LTAIVNYGGGNLRSVENAFRVIGSPFKVTQSSQDVAGADRVVLPGVGHFDRFVTSIDELDLRDCLVEAATDGRPFLGICLGMQALFEGSEEGRGEARGLAVVPGRVGRFPTGSTVPHMCWNEVAASDPVVPGGWYTFAHSYVVPVLECTVGTCDYHGPFSAAVRAGNALGVQFHPEKSGSLGLDLLRAFCGVSP